MKEEGKKKTYDSPGEAEHTKRANYRTTAQRKWKEVKRKHTGDYTGKVETMGSFIQMEKHTSYTQPPDMPYFK